MVADRAALTDMVSLWLTAGVRILQYRNKQCDARPREALADCREMVRVAYSLGVRDQTKLVMNDRADLMLAAEFDGVHVGQDDLAPESVRGVIGVQRFFGLSCHNEAQIEAAEATGADYLAIGPIFATGSKANPDPVVGLERLRHIRQLTRKPLVAIGGITRENAGAVWDCGADSVAVISDLYKEPEKAIDEWMTIVRNR